MRQRTWKVLYVVAAALGVLAWCAEPGISQSDSVRITGTWSPVLQANGQPASYRARMMRLAPPRDTIWVAVTTSATTLALTVARPPAGDSSKWQLRLRAFDVRGDSSLLVSSAVLVLRRPWLPPPPPQLVQLDTTAASAFALPDSAAIYAVRDSAALYSSPDRSITLRVGESLPFLPGSLARWRPGGGAGPARGLLREVGF
jgi:hypothetical protein